MSDVTLGGVDRKRIAEVLQQRRERLGLTLEQVAERMGMSAPSVSNLMTGNHTYPVEVLDQVARALDWSVITLLKKVQRPEQSEAMRRIAKVISRDRAQESGQ
jgi:transcriptional regulator with XRE-family HTH domain